MADIFDKITEGINKGVATVGVGSKAMVGKAKVKTVINNFEKERARNAELLGMLVYERFVESGQTPDDEDMAALFSEINKCLEGIAQQQEELKLIEEEAAKVAGQRTSSMGGQPGYQPSHPPGNHPGTPHGYSPGHPPINPAVGASKVCSCGFENDATAKFCAGCGSPI